MTSGGLCEQGPGWDGHPAPGLGAGVGAGGFPCWPWRCVSCGQGGASGSVSLIRVLEADGFEKEVLGV